MSSTPTPPRTTAADSERRDSREKLRTQAYVAATLAVLLTIEIVAFGLYAYYRVEQALEPQNVADRVEEAVQENYPAFREELITQAHARAPEFANEVSKSFVAAAPQARLDLERLAARQLALGLDSATQLSADQFREVLQQNREQLVKVFEAIEDAPEEAHQLVLESEANIEKQLGVDLQRQAKLAVRNLGNLNTKLERLAGPLESLSAKEQVERRIVRVLRAMQESETNVQISAVPQTRR